MDVKGALFSLPDGRELRYRVTESERGASVLLLTGTPSAGIAPRAAIAAAAERGLRLVTYSRPGYEDSTRLPERSVADCVPDVEALAVGLELEPLYVVGWSGGGPHALACAALLPGRKRAAATLAGVAPWDADGLAWLDGMGPENVDEFRAALAGEKALRSALAEQRAELAQVTGDQVAEALGGLVADVDRSALDGELADYIATGFRKAVSTGIDGWVDDDLAFARGWGFSLDAIGVPITVWQGDEDRMVPFAHGEWLSERVPGAAPRLLSGEGHISLVERFGDIVDDLVARGG